MKILIFLAFLIFASGCTSRNNEATGSLQEDTALTADTLIEGHPSKEYYKKMEDKAMDSVTKHGITDQYHNCISILYGLYGSENLVVLESREGITVGETDIRIVDFKRKSSDRFQINFEIFGKDSLPVKSERNFRTTGGFLYAFEIDPATHKIVRGLLDTDIESSISLEDLVKLAEQERNGIEYLEYLESHKNTLSLNFMNHYNRKFR